MKRLRPTRLVSVFFLFLMSGLMAFANQPGDSLRVSSIPNAFKQAQFKVQLRNSLMATVNDGPLQDYWANAFGGLFRMETARYKGFSAGISTRVSLKTLESPLDRIDEITGKTAKWERELFNYLDESDRKDFSRLEEFFLSYHVGESFVKIGKQDINQGPLFLRRDGRMMPFVYRGLWSELVPNQHQKIYLGWIDGIAPRGLDRWYNMNEAIGLNGNGFEPDGSRADYHETSGTRGIAVIGWESKGVKNLRIQGWNYWFHKMMNTTWIQADWKYKSVYGGMQYAHQFAIEQQKSLAYNERYIQPDQKAHVVSGKLGLKKGKSDLSVAYLHAFDTGRFLFPRELGREDFYVSQPRSWIDGFGDLDVYMLRLKNQLGNSESSHLDLRLSATRTSGLEDREFNKYGLGSFYQATLGVDHAFQKKWKGLELFLLYVFKVNDPSEQIPLASRAYLSNIHHINLILNFTF